MGQGRARGRNPRGMILRRGLFAFLAGACCGVLAQGYPERPVRLIVPQAAGSATDTVARILAAELPNHLGQPVVVENKPVGALAITRHMVAKLPYDIERDFQPIALVTRGHLLLAVSPSLPVNSVQELIEYARKNPGRLMNASSSNGSPGHVGGELFKYMTGTEIMHIPYKGGAMAINDLIAGHVQVMFESLNSISTFARSGKVKALAVSGPRRSPGFPNLPTIAEAGVPGYDATTWSGVIGPAGMARPIVDKLNSSINKAIVSPMFKARFGEIGDEPAGGTPEEFAEVIRRDSAKWAEVVKRSGAKID